MLLLYNGNGSGSQEVQLVKQHPQVHWELVKRQAVNSLRLGHDTECVDVLEKMLFEHWNATNGFGDEFEVLYLKLPIGRYLEIESDSDTYRGKSRYKKIAQALEQVGSPIRFIGIDASTEDAEMVSTPQLQITSAAVVRALSDFEALVGSKGGIISGVDRIHTALHGYLRAVCDKANIPHSDKADITKLFNLIREQHPKLQNHPPGKEAQKMLRALGQIVDVLNPVRNSKSMAHPNEELLDEPEAMLVANAIRGLLHYLNSKLR